jgi:large subunit ribosomal protein L28
MSRVCVVCDKKPTVANSVSNANNRTKRWVFPNVHMMRFSFPSSTSVQRGSVCTKCVKAGLVKKVV